MHEPCPFCKRQPYTQEWRESKGTTQNGTKLPEVWFVGCCCFFTGGKAFHGTEKEALEFWDKQVKGET